MRRAVFLFVCASASGCGGLIAPGDAGPDDGGGRADAAERGDATLRDAGGDAEGGGDGEPLCSVDASPDSGPCIDPADDILYADPAVISVAAGGYGTANFVAEGPWINDPKMYIWFDGSTLDLIGLPKVRTYGSPQAIVFQVTSDSAGQQGTFTVKGHAGNIVRTATATVNVTDCVPWTPSFVCGSNNCGFEPDDCGGLTSCGTCGTDQPFCFLGKCQVNTPEYCPSGYGLGPNGKCFPCGMTTTCRDCVSHRCYGIEDVCICETDDGGTGN